MGSEASSSSGWDCLGPQLRRPPWPLKCILRGFKPASSLPLGLHALNKTLNAAPCHVAANSTHLPAEAWVREVPCPGKAAVKSPGSKRETENALQRCRGSSLPFRLERPVCNLNTALEKTILKKTNKQNKKTQRSFLLRTMHGSSACWVSREGDAQGPGAGVY